MSITMLDVQSEGLSLQEPFTVQANVPVEKVIKGRKTTVTEQVDVSLDEMGAGDRVTFWKSADISHLRKVRLMAESKHLALVMREPSPAQKENGIIGGVLRAIVA